MVILGPAVTASLGHLLEMQTLPPRARNAETEVLRERSAQHSLSTLLGGSDGAHGLEPLVCWHTSNHAWYVSDKWGQVLK